MPDKEAFYIDHRHAKSIQNLNNKNLGDYYDLYVQIGTLLLTDVFENFTNKCIEIYELDPAHFLFAPGLVGLKKTEIKLDLLTSFEMY